MESGSGGGGNSGQRSEDKTNKELRNKRTKFSTRNENEELRIKRKRAQKYWKGRGVTGQLPKVENRSGSYDMTKNFHQHDG